MREFQEIHAMQLHYQPLEPTEHRYVKYRLMHVQQSELVRSMHVLVRNLEQPAALQLLANDLVPHKGQLHPEQSFLHKIKK